MGKVTKADLIEAIDDVLVGPILQWDYYVTVDNADISIRYSLRRMRQIGGDHSIYAMGAC